jgi:Domain of unknown function (DUF5615)
MLRLLADENFNGRIVRGLLLREPELDLVRTQDVGLSGTADPDVLDWAAEQQRILLTHDRETIPGYAFERVDAGSPMPGVVVADDKLAVGAAIDDLLLFALCSDEGEWEGQVLYLPLR